MSLIDAHHPLTAAGARRQLAREFPGVAPRIITAVLAAYRRVTPNLAAAVSAARGRLRDACRT
jgi:hypothetical protein